MGIISWILLGLVAGALAKAIRPGRDPQGCIVTMIIGIVGAVLGGWIATMFGWGRVDGFNVYSLLVATGGAVLASLADTLMPEAFEEGGPWIAYATSLGFLLSFPVRFALRGLALTGALRALRVPPGLAAMSGSGRGGL